MEFLKAINTDPSRGLDLWANIARSGKLDPWRRVVPRMLAASIMIAAPMIGATGCGTNGGMVCYDMRLTIRNSEGETLLSQPQRSCVSRGQMPSCRFLVPKDLVVNNGATISCDIVNGPNSK